MNDDVSSASRSTSEARASSGGSGDARSLSALRSRLLAGDLPLVVGVTLFFVLVYAVVDAPLYNPGVTIDPWLYTAFFINFEFSYDLFGTTYYASRLPWIIPGLAAYSAFPPRAAYFLLHLSFFLGGALFLFLLVRSYLGRIAAIVAYAALLGNQLYYNAEYWEYIDGPVITFLLGTAYFALTRASGLKRVVHLAAGGFFAAAAVTTNLFSAFVVLPLVVVYLVLNVGAQGRAVWRVVLRDAAGVVFGAAILIVGCGLFARVHGQPFLFFMSQYRAARAIEASVYKAQGFDWIESEPRLLVPVFLVAVAALLVRGASANGVRGIARTFAIAMIGFLAAFSLIFLAWEVVGDAAVLQYMSYFSWLAVGFALCAGVAAHLALSRLHGAPRRVVVAGVVCAVLAAAAPMLVVYGSDIAALTGSTGTKTTIAMAAVTVVLAGRLAVSRAQTARRTLAIVVAAGVVLTANWGVGTSAAVFKYGRSNGANGDVFALGFDLVRFLRDNGFQEARLGFWYDQDSPRYLVGLQSLYFYGYTAIGFDLPDVEAPTRRVLKTLPPEHIVMLCKDVRCDGGPAALRAAGYSIRERANRKLAAGARSVWVRVFEFNGMQAPTG